MLSHTYRHTHPHTHTHTHTFYVFSIKKPSKIGIQGNNPHFFLWHVQDQNIFKNFFKNLSITQFGMPKKLMPKSQAKINPSFSQYSFLTIF